MKFSPLHTMAAAVLAVTGAIAAAPAQAQNTQVGTLTCEVAGGAGMIIGSNKQITCSFQNVAGEIEVYGGEIRKFGLDIGATGRGVIVWSVFAPSGAWRHGALAGTYGGATAQATVIAGVGANVLLGGSNRSIALQPISVSGQTGLNLAVGVADLRLEYLPPEPRRRRRG
jgi:hypothetical protein